VNQRWVNVHDNIIREITYIYESANKKEVLIKMVRLSDKNVATLKLSQFEDMVKLGCFTLYTGG
jgi:hypothetical protein